MNRPAAKPPRSGNTKIIGGTVAGVLAAAAGVLALQEGVVLTSYADPVWGWKVPTACVGETGPHIRPGQTFTHQECMQMLGTRVASVWRQVDACLDRPVPANVAVSVVDLAYNVGSGAVCSSTLVRQINRGDTPEVYCEQFRRWVYVGGKDCRIRSNNCAGIVTRREHARAMCLGQTPATG